MANGLAQTFVILFMVATATGAQADDDVNCRRLVHVPCGDSACFFVNFDNARKLASVSIPPGASRHKGDLDAAACFSRSWKQISFLERLVEREREGRGTVPTSFSFAMHTRCEISDGSESDDIPPPWEPNYSSKPTC